MSEIVLTEHVKFRLMERSVSVHDARKIAKSGKIIKNLDGGLVKKEGLSSSGKIIVVVCKETKYPKNVIVVVTAYYGNKTR